MRPTPGLALTRATRASRMKDLVRAVDGLQRWILQPVFVLAVVAGGFIGSAKLAERREPPQRAPSATYAPLVSALATRRAPVTVHVRGNGALAARTRIGLVPQVGGEVVAMHPELRAGGRFRAGEVLFAVEPRDYELAVARAEADVSATDTALAKVEAEAVTARAEWNALHPDLAAPPLAALEPQLAEARARRAAAAAALAKAQLDLERTRVLARFDGRVVSAALDVGQVIAPNQRVGEVYASDTLEVAVPLAQDELAWLALPGEQGETSPATLRARIDGAEVVVPGRLARIGAELAGSTRLATLVVEVDAKALRPELALRLVPGTFVDVDLEGVTLDDVTRVPRAALREDGVVWTVAEGRVAFARPEVIKLHGGDVLVRGLADGAVIVTSELAVITEGMHVRAAIEGSVE